MSLTCPVCGYDKINEPTLKWSICPSCGTQFGLSDSGRTHAQLRHEWIYDNRADWQDGYILPPPYWSPIKQLRNIGYECTLADRRRITWRETVSIETTTVTDMGGYIVGRIDSMTRGTVSNVINIQDSPVRPPLTGTLTKVEGRVSNDHITYNGFSVCLNF